MWFNSMQKKKKQGASPARNSPQYSSIDFLSRHRYMEPETSSGKEIYMTKESLGENIDAAIKENGMSSGKSSERRAFSSLRPKV